MVLFYFCASCDFNFSKVITGAEGPALCPRCGGVPKRKYRRYRNSVTGFSFEEFC